MEHKVANKGLEGVVVEDSCISKVMPEINSLVYYGYPVQSLAEECSFEEVAYLLLKGDLPNERELKTFKETEKSNRHISDNLTNLISMFDNKAHPMDTLRTAISYLGIEDRDVSNYEKNYEISCRLFAKIPIIVAYDYRTRAGKEIIKPRLDLSFIENFFYMCFGSVPDKGVLKAFGVSMILYAEHTFNASTFTSRVVISSLSDIYGAVTAAIASLKGPLHGGANEAVMHMMKEIGNPDKARDWMLDALDTGKKVMGFGHRVYKSGDSRVPTMKKYMLSMSEIIEEDRWARMYEILAKTMFDKKGIHPNLDFPTGPTYYMMGFEIETFTPIFVISRITGWTAHIIEQLNDNRLIRPLSNYVGPSERQPIPISKR